jgi:hypothetical protein
VAVSTLSPEAQLLFLTAGPAENDAQIRALVHAESLRWPVVTALAAATKSTGVLWRRFNRVTGGDLPAEARERMQHLALVTDFRLAHLRDRVLHVVDVITGMQLDGILLKGAALAIAAYRSFPDRPMGDVDILLAPDDAVQVQQTLLNAGWWERLLLNPDADTQDRRRDFYTSHHHLPPLADNKGTGVALELHTDLFPPGAPFRLPPYRVREAAQKVSYEGREISVPSTEHLLLHLCLHFAWSNEMRSGAWRTFRDVHAIATSRTVDWERVVAAAELARASTCCYWTLRLAQSVAGVPFPPDAARMLRPRLPEAVLRRVELHFAHELMPTESICPSVRAGRAMWELAIRPEWSGHGRIRPWLASGGTPLLPSRTADLGIRKLVRQVQRVAHWGEYAKAILMAGRSPRQTPTPPRLEA